MEEALRAYFAELGYFVVRGVPFSYEGFDVTDVDLWIYARTSSVARHRSIVDIKNKRTPQAIERIFWVRGLKAALGVDQAIVATTDNRGAVRDFGREMDVTVLDGSFTAKLEKKYGNSPGRFSEEHFIDEITHNMMGQLDGDWKGRYLDGKACLIDGLTFDSCNKWLNHGRFFVEQMLSRPQKAEAACRLLYIMTAFFCVGVDFLLKELAFSELSEKKKVLTEGFTYGSRGAGGTENMIQTALDLVEHLAPNGKQTSQIVKDRLNQEFSNLRSNILSEYFGRVESARSLFQVAKTLETRAMQTDFQGYQALEPECQSALGVILDYWDIERRKVIDALQ